jgi:hypothetical protein
VLGLSCFHAAAEPQASALMRKEAIADVQALRENPAFADSLEIVVKFRDDGKVKHIVDAFWRDPEVARARFDVFKQGRPEMAAAVLLRVTYSNELVLAYPCKTATKAQHTIEARDVAAKLMASPDIAYAEPNLSFQTQG